MDACKNSSRKLIGMNEIVKVIRQYEKIIAFILATMLMMAAQYYINAQKFDGDAEVYWRLSSSIWDFSFPQVIRGYFYPLLLSPLKLASEAFPSTGYMAFYVVQALAYSFALTILLPYLFTRLVGGEISFVRRLVLPVLTAVFFPGLISYPLSDLPAFCLIVASVSLILYASEKNNIFQSAILFFLAGIFLYGAYNTRTIYLFTLIPVVIFSPIFLLKNKKNTYRALLSVVLILGCALAALPQALINLKYLNSPTPFVVATIKDSSLFAKQLKWGITIYRYETGYDINSKEIFPVFYVNPTGENVIKEYGSGGASATIAWYFGAFLSDPISFVKIYTTHFINGMDVRDYDTYTKYRSKESSLRSVASISISLLGLFFLVALIVRKSGWTRESARKEFTLRLVWVGILLLPVILIIPSAIETRFFLPLHLLAYSALAFGFSIRNILSLPIKTKILYGALYMVMVTTFYIHASESVFNPSDKFPQEYR